MNPADNDLLADQHLLSPANLARADMGQKFTLARHLRDLNRRLVAVGYAAEGTRLIVNMMQQVGKSTLVCVYFVAWLLLLWPHKRVILLTGKEELAVKFGRAVRDVINRWGAPQGVRLRKDTQAVGNWLIEGHGGGMVCRSRGSSPAGEEADLVVIDDLVLDGNEALSDAILETNWRFVQSVVLGRLRRETSLVMVGTRWSRKDHFARMLEEARKAGDLDRWQVVKYLAVAEEQDVLGRKPGEHLWPEKVNPKDVEFARQTSPFFEAAWQQRPPDEEGAHFRPYGWPVYADYTATYGQRAWVVTTAGGSRTTVFPRDVTTFVTVDWAASERRWSDFTAMGAWALLPDRRLLALEVKAGKYPLEAVVGKLAEFVRFWRPDVVACEADAFQAALANECRRHKDLGEIRRLKSGSRTKLQRALGAITWGQNGRILLPEGAPWLDAFRVQLSQFAGRDGDSDDMVDCLSYAVQTAEQVAPYDDGGGAGPTVLTEGKSPFW